MKTYDCLDIADSDWIGDLYAALADSAWPVGIDPRKMSAEDVRRLCAYLRTEYTEYTAGAVAGQLEALLPG